MKDLAYQSATALCAAMERREVSSLELLDHLLRRIERLDPAINAVVASDVDGARERARQADAARARGDSWGPLHGLPMTIKDSIEVAGMPTTSGAPELADHRPSRHADAVERLVAAGAIVFGKTNLPLYAGDFQSFNDVYGTTNNPWNLERSPGGSSGGAAAALAAGFTPLELGSDIGGSIRNPAHFCGVAGHKPSFGLVSGRGHVPAPPGSLAPTDLAVLGPMARSVEDLELGLEVVAGPAPADALAWRLALPEPRHRALGEFRVAVWLEQAGRPVAATVGERLAAVVSQLTDRVARLDERARPAFDPEDAHALYLRLLWSVMGAGFPEPVLAGLRQEREGLATGDTRPSAQMARGATASHLEWLGDDEARHRLRATWGEFFRDFDVLLCPIMSTTAFPHDHGPMQDRSLDVNGASVPYLEQVFWAGLATLAYLPATLVPVGVTGEGLPVGIQVIAPYLEDRTALHFARLLEDLLGGFQAPPGYDD